MRRGFCLAEGVLVGWCFCTRAKRGMARGGLGKGGGEILVLSRCGRDIEDGSIVFECCLEVLVDRRGFWFRRLRRW